MDRNISIIRDLDGNKTVVIHDIVHIGSDLPDEFAGSKYTMTLKGTLAKAKANAAQGIPEMVEIAVNPRQRNNLTEKHMVNAKYGWYYYDSCFALPVYNNDGSINRYNVFYAQLLIRHAANGKLYLYDIINIKKEAGNLF